MEGMGKRFREFEKLLPRFEDHTDAQKQFAESSIVKHREKVRSLT
jgi:hypothetical protein